VVLQLGCGLDTRFWRVDNDRVTWYDLDMPPVADLPAVSSPKLSATT
jgi:O-methyltransferase involved in polyketide biosynthesis